MTIITKLSNQQGFSNSKQQRYTGDLPYQQVKKIGLN